MPVFRSCLYCDSRFEVSLEWRLMCGDSCKERFNREHDMVCFYCGELAESRDHIFPQSFRSFNGFEGQETLNCCMTCNVTMGNAEALSVERRIERLISRTVRKFNLSDIFPEWDDAEVEELGYALRTAVKGKIRARQRAADRVDHMRRTLIAIMDKRLGDIMPANDNEEPDIEAAA